MAFDKTLITGFTQVSGGEPGFAPAVYSSSYTGDSADFGPISDTEFDLFMRGKGVNVGDCIIVSCGSGTHQFTLGMVFEVGNELTLRVPILLTIT